jgi:hypothetical protein
MQQINTSQIKNRTARWSIWTIRHHDLIVSQLSLYTFGATALVLLVVLSGKISLESALAGLMLGALAIGLLLWILIEQRKSILLNIDDPQLRRRAHQAMLEFMAHRREKVKKLHPQLTSRIHQ